MASRYDNLDAHKQLEQAIADDLRAALGPRGCKIAHNGTATSPALGGMADITVTDPANGRLLLVEVTKRKGASAGGEFEAITDHLDKAVAASGYKDYCCLYVSPQTSARMALNFLDRHNRLRQGQNKKGRIVAIDFATLDEAIRRWKGNDRKLYPASRIGALFSRWQDASDDARARQVVAETLFAEDEDFTEEAREQLREHDTASEQALRASMKRLEDRLRHRGITGAHANETLIYLTFLRLYEEKRQRDHGDANRFTADGFAAWGQTLGAKVQAQFSGRLVQYLLEEIAEDPALKAAGLLRVNGKPDELHAELRDDFMVKEVLENVFDRYSFYSSSLDVLGVVFETLARRAEKDTTVGQFFTPQEVVHFCAQLVRLKANDVVLDPAVGTGRFLIAAMTRMLAATNSEDERARIRKQQLFGTDIDDWVVTIAKMNMFIHGDGKTTVAKANGLALRDRPVFGALFKSGIGGGADVVLTNPPLGDTSYRVALDAWKDKATRAVTPEDEAGFFESLAVVPMRDDPSPAQRQFESAKTRLAEHEKTLRTLATEPASPEREKEIARVTRQRDRAIDDVKDMGGRVGSLPMRPHVATGESMKGGALFLGAIANYLKGDRLPQEVVEWQGGRCAVVVDEAILNTPDYGHVRRFIRNAFFVKAVISLGRPAFKYLAHTDAKTSVLFLVKKPDANLVQTEPVFFAHAERVGYSATGKWIGSDLGPVRLRYDAFEKAVLGAYVRRRFDKARFAERVSDVPGIGEKCHYRDPPESEAGRLDFFDARFHDLVKRLKAKGTALTTIGELMRPVVPVAPTPATDDTYEFASIDRNLGTISSKGRVATSYGVESLWCVREGNIVVSGIDLVHGAVAVAGKDVDGLVMSKEMFPYEATDKVLPEYLVLLLRAEIAKTLIHGRVTGTSNRTRITAPDEILDIPIPAPPSKAQQEKIVEKLIDARARYSKALTEIGTASSTVAEKWGVTVDDTPDSIDDGEVESANAL